MPIVWMLLGLVIVVAAVRSRRSRRALQVGRLAVAALFLGAGALVNAFYLARGDDYAGFAQESSIAFVRDTWESLVVPHASVFIGLLVVFELAVGVLVLLAGRWAVYGLGAAVAFHVALLSFGWGFGLWAVPMIGALWLLLRAQTRDLAAGGPDRSAVPSELSRPVHA